MVLLVLHTKVTIVFVNVHCPIVNVNVHCKYLHSLFEAKNLARRVLS